jgi:cellulose biosynthesis protein BcsQ
MARIAEQPGEIITFYSFKGGTGRTMALANVASLLSERLQPAQKILAIDWDLEAPGLHRFLTPLLGQPRDTSPLGLDGTPGLIDLFIAISDGLPQAEAESEEASIAAVQRALAGIDPNRYVGATSVPNVDLLRAGRNDDGAYASRTSTFDWERLFRRAPTVYQSVAEILAKQYRYVLVDSRTGVSDTSGICTSIVPEKLVAVFTPNRQSLMGVKEVLERAIKYRSKSDDLRSLAVFPLPSRIEASLEKLRLQWRFGDPDKDIIGYQPLFEDLFKSAYNLAECDLSKYFDDVQIQQTPDFAYGEEIAVRRVSDRFSIQQSYREFLVRLLSGVPPWVGTEVNVRTISLEQASRLAPSPSITTPPVVKLETANWKAKQPERHVSETAGQVFLSYAREDRERVQSIAEMLSSRGFDVWWDRSIPAGVQYDRAVAAALDASAVVIVFWSRASVASTWVTQEAEEGMRRGVLIPVLIDDVAPPFGFRQLQVVDLRRDPERNLQALVDGVTYVAGGRPGVTSSLMPASSAARSRLRTGLVSAASFLVVATLIFGALRWYRYNNAPALTRPPTAGTVSAVPPKADVVRVPNFVGAETKDILKAAEFLGLRIAITDERGTTAAFLDGVVTSQKPDANTEVVRGRIVTVQVATRTVTVPAIVGLSLERALGVLESSSLRLGRTETAPVQTSRPGTIVRQSPNAGSRVAAGTVVDVVVASRAPDARTPR